MNRFQHPRSSPVLWHACRSFVSTSQNCSATDLSSHQTTPSGDGPQLGSDIKPAVRAYYNEFIHAPTTLSPIQNT
jgi:hypothetical protein